ncbi:SusD/RagB family nutrient-binding outer membrane lipoprotein [Chitinophaga agrisoli]|uniref:SusD/RagB family nutrient-binding outer membrane lipoprotein n=1 Tax=Chitinophaga agrisoli TaxID=2607653 RepID=A0A5B2VSU0_9BACT|nr:SusD/RagB family nutrient-binding outer membrane lipoprotein [Chitinophaga agrisoli]KAA2241327.1 SusD/RagB family nutrient-binding outer membrane lipoprotein [Chitinophaga agrisoli]
MKTIIKHTSILLMGGLMMQSCSKFNDFATDPKSVSKDQVVAEYALNGSIMGAQMNPDIAERSFVLYWKTGGHQQQEWGLSDGDYDDGWTTAYYNGVAGWLNGVNLAIEVAQKNIDAGTVEVYTKNLLQVSRIWRAYLLTEMSDNFGPVAIKTSQGTNPEFVSVKDVYYFALQELTEAVAAIDKSVVNPPEFKDYDPAFAFDYDKWTRYANSLRLRLAIRLSEVDAVKAKTEYEAAAKLDLLTTPDQIFKVQEKQGWDDLSGVMSREWNAQMLSATLNNLYIGLGGITSAAQLPDSLDAYIKPANWAGRRFVNHFSTMTNDPTAGFFFDGLHNTIDPRAYKAFIIPGQYNNPDFCAYPSWTTSAKTTTRELTGFGNLDAKYTWNAYSTGDWGDKGAKNLLWGFEGTTPRLALRFRNSLSQRIFFGPWETYFLLAEGAEKGWTSPMTAQAAYEAGIAASFNYWGVDQYLGAYLASNDYNNAGTSVSWNHTTEPGNTHAVNYVDGYNGAAGTAQMAYPVNTLYKNGAIRNDHLTKIITQKFIAQVPWLPLEAWSDQRRLGLPFYENPGVDKPILTLPALTSSTYMTSSIKFFPQRLKYPSSLQNGNPTGYKQALENLGAGGDAILTPIWWAKQH